MKRKNLFLTLGLPLLMLATVAVLIFLVQRAPWTEQTADVRGENAEQQGTEASDTASATGNSAASSAANVANSTSSRSTLGQGQGKAELERVLEAEAPVDLPEDLPDPPSSFAEGEGLLRYRLAQINFEPPAAVKANPGAADARPKPADRVFEFPLFPGATFVGLAETHQQHAADQPRGVYVGKLAGYPGSIFTLAYNKGNYAGSLMIPGRGEFVLLPAAPGLVRVGQVDVSKVRACRSGPLPQKQGLTTSSSGGVLETTVFDPVAPLALLGSGEQIDVLIVYSTLIAISYGSLDGLQAVVDRDFAFANQSYANSDVDLFLGQAGLEPVDYTDSGSLETDLTFLTLPGDGVLEEVRDLRADSNADLVSLYVDLQTTDSPFIVLGLAWLVLDPNDNELGYSVVRPQLGPVTFVHEVGHNLGCLHDRENATPIPGAEPYSYGWRFFGDDGELYHTIMAYQPGIAIPHFSNPDVLFQGQPTGNPKLDPIAPAFNAATLSENAPNVANFSELPDDPTSFEVLAAPTNFRVSQGLFEESVQLQWNGPGPMYRVFRGLDDNLENASFLAEVQGDGLAGFYFDDVVLKGVEYYYWVRTSNEFGQISPAVGPQKGFTSTETEVAAPDGVSAGRGNHRGFVRVSWDNVPEKPGYRLSYEIIRSQLLGHTEGTLFTFQFPWYGERVWDDESAMPGIEYYYWVRAVYQSISDPTDFIVGEAAGPALGYEKLPKEVQKVPRLSVTDGTNWQDIIITWEPASNAEQYEIYRSTTDSPLGRLLLMTFEAWETRYWRDWTAVPGVEYYYWIRGVNEFYEGEFAGPEEGMNPASPAPQPPNVSAGNGEYRDRIRVSWSASSGAKDYVIYRNTTADFGTATVVVQGSPFDSDYSLMDREYHDDSPELTVGQEYYYWVAGINDQGVIGPPGGPATGTLKRQPPPPPTGVNASDGIFIDFVQVSWLASPTATSYRVYRWGADETAADAQLVGSTEGLAFQDTSAEPGIIYYYAVRAKSDAGLGELSLEDFGFRFDADSQPPFAPLGVEASDAAFVDQVLVTWPGTFNTQFYRVYRALDALGTGAVLLGETVVTSFIDEEPLYFQDEYFYFVTAVNSVGESIFGPGDPGSAIPPEDLIPTDIFLDDNSILENLPVNTLIGQFTTTGPDVAYTYSLGPDDETESLDWLEFAIAGDELRSDATFDFETQETYNIGVTTTSPRGLSFSKDFMVDIIDVEPELGPLITMRLKKGAGGRELDLSWAGSPTEPQLYQLQMSETLAPDSWVDLGEPTTHNTLEMSMQESPQCFFRIVPVPAPAQ